jgi:hypothetical protein
MSTCEGVTECGCLTILFFRRCGLDHSPAHLSQDGSQDGVSRVYLLHLEDLVELARARVTRPLTTEECQKYLHVQECPTEP